jgi:hypothetical protein
MIENTIIIVSEINVIPNNILNILSEFSYF